MKPYRFYIGIDCGVKTGFCVWDKQAKKILVIKTVMIHEAIQYIKDWNNNYYQEVFVRVEDARQRKWFGNAGREQLQGAGSVKRDAKIWEDFLTSENIPFDMVAPKNNKTKLSAEAFVKLTQFTKRTSVHARDAAALVIGI